MPTRVEIGPMVDLLGSQWRAFAELCAPLGPEQWATPTCLPGWTVQDQLAHVVGVEMMLAGEPAPDVDVSHLTHVRNDVGRMAEVWVEWMRPLSGAEVLERFRQVTDERLAALRAMTQAEFDAPSWTPVAADETYGRFMRIRHYDAFMHEHDVRDALDLPARDDPDALAAALAEVEPGLGYLVGKKAAFPDGSSLRIELHGALERTYHVVVDGRAALVDEPDDEPTVTLRLPVTTFLRLTGGRAAALPRLGVDVQLDGDDDLGRRLLADLSLTI
jgi:uncharacterized protein (TIGR03083 family)